MDEILNSGLTQWVIKFAFSKSGVLIRWAIGYLMGWLVAKNILPSGNVDQITISLTSGLTAVVAILYAWLNYWVNARLAKGVQVVQKMVDAPQTDGIVGNKTILAVADATGANPHEAIAAVTDGSAH